jgi:hypothetical protein
MEKIKQALYGHKITSGNTHTQQAGTHAHIHGHNAVVPTTTVQTEVIPTTTTQTTTQVPEAPVETRTI